MIKWLIQNKEWLFSGLGVVIILGLLKLVKNKFPNKKKEAEKLKIHLFPSSETSKKTDNPELIPIEKVNLLSLSDIDKIIKNAPPLKHASKKEGSDIVHLSLAPGLEGEKSLSAIYCEVSLNDYRELGILPEGARIRIQGEIKKADRYEVELTNVKLFFLEK
jgi:hypothetical protein